MEEASIDKLEELIKCPVCLETCTTPRILNCSHVYCQKCLIGLVERNQEAQGHHLPCPECREVTPMPARGVAGLRSARLANSLIEFLGHAKEADAVKTHHCPEHMKELESFCYDCGECLCCDCVCGHREHSHVDTHTALERYRCEVLPDLEGIRAKELDCNFTELPEVFKADVMSAQAKSSHLIESFKKHLIAEDKIEALKMMWVAEKKFHEILDKLDRKCFAEGRGLEEASIGEMATFLFHAINLRSKALETLECLLVHEDSGLKVLSDVKKAELGRYTFKMSYQAANKKLHQLHIKVLGQHIKGSPFTVAVASGILKGPCGIAIREQKVFISEMNGHSISVCSLSLDRLKSFGTHGCGKGQLNSPRGLAIDNEGNVLVADCNNHRIQKFTEFGKFLQAAGSKGSGRLQFIYPKDIAINPITKMVYVVDANHRVQILNFDLFYYNTFGRHGNGLGEFSDPHGIACDSTGKVYVADTGNHRIQVFTAEGDVLDMFDTTKKRKLEYPICIAVDTFDIIYVGEKGCNCISRFLSGKHFLSLIETVNPHGIAAVNSRCIYVCDGDSEVGMYVFKIPYSILCFLVLIFGSFVYWLFT